jgi:hypothetical protein
LISVVTINCSSKTSCVQIKSLCSSLRDNRDIHAVNYEDCSILECDAV